LPFWPSLVALHRTKLSVYNCTRIIAIVPRDRSLLNPYYLACSSFGHRRFVSFVCAYRFRIVKPCVCFAISSVSRSLFITSIRASSVQNLCGLFHFSRLILTTTVHNPPSRRIIASKSAAIRLSNGITQTSRRSRQSAFFLHQEEISFEV
jgi:hypothetical protein